ncbi:PIN domain-containing protein [Candidatus Gracilibacteria bacterium]|nr:PIN domain-containing protein [Candidatus Gracilibacteria bacterium]
MKTYIFDTSFLVSLLDIDDINHKIAVESISNLEIGSSNKFYINDIILNETYTTLNYKKGFNFLNLFDKFLEGIEIIYITGNNDEYITFFKMLKSKISVADSSVIYDSFKHNLEILTFDKEIIKLHKKYI